MSDDGNESRDNKTTDTEEKSQPTSPSHASETKSNSVLSSCIQMALYTIVVKTKEKKAKGGGGG
jgi:hypothetical protein